MGYKRNPKLYRLTFADGGDMDGLEVTLRSVSVGQMLDMRGGTEDKETTALMMGLLAERLVGWNLEEEDGSPVPPTMESIKREDFDFVMAIIDKWVEAVSGVSAPLEKPSSGGGTSPEVSIPMETLSTSLAS